MVSAKAAVKRLMGFGKIFKNNFMKTLIKLMPLILTGFDFLQDNCSQIPNDYHGKAFQDSIYKGGPQVIPGRIELAYYDLGGEGVAYHDVTAVNEGAALNHTSGHWRPGVPAYIAFFRENEGVDISYTKDWADFNHPNKVDPKVNQLYIGWEENGEWTNYTVDIKVTGKYKIITIYGFQNNNSSLWLNNKEAVKFNMPENTGSFHSWTQATVGEISFPVAGLNLLTLKYNKGANLAFLDFVLVEEKK
jgi:hypothetical protein